MSSDEGKDAEMEPDYPEYAGMTVRELAHLYLTAVTAGECLLDEIVGFIVPRKKDLTREIVEREIQEMIEEGLLETPQYIRLVKRQA